MVSAQAAIHALSDPGQNALNDYEQYLRVEIDLSQATIRNYLGDLRLFVAWCQEQWSEGSQPNQLFSPQHVTTPTLTRYRDHLQHEAGCKPATVNRYLISLKRYFCWLADQEIISRDPARAVKLVPQTSPPPRHLTDQEEDALVAAASAGNNMRDYVLVVLMLNTGLRAGEVCQLKWEDIVIGPRSGRLRVWGKRNKYREVPLNVTVRKALAGYGETLKSKTGCLFPSRRTSEQLTPRAIGFIIEKYSKRAGVENIRPHDLRHRFGYRMAERVPLHRLAQIMGHDSLDTTMLYVQGTPNDLQQAVEQIAWE
jgi:integrase/recombinase XerD